MKKLFVFLNLLLFTSVVIAQNNHLNKYAGTYVFSNAPFTKVIVTVENNVLMGEAEGMGKAELRSSGEVDEFLEDNNNATLKFLKGSGNDIDKLEISASGMVLLGTKVKADLTEYVGKYNLVNNPTLTDLEIVLSGKSLVVETNIGSSELLPTSKKDLFNLSAVEGQVTFERDSKTGKVIKVLISALDQTFEGQKK